MAAYASSDSATGTGSAVVTKPTGLAAGDLMVAIVSDRGSNFESGEPSTPSGWTAIVSETSDAAVGIAVFAKVADAGDAAAANFTFSHSNGSAPVAAAMYRITGTFTSAVNVYRSVANIGTEPSADVFRFANGITPDVASTLLIMGVTGYSSSNGFDDSNATAYALEISNPTWTERHDFAFAGAPTAHRLSTATATRTEVTATGYFQITYTAAGSETPNNAVGVLLGITDTANGSHSATVIVATATINAPSATGTAQASPSVITAAATINAPTATGGTNDALWKNTDKPSAGTINNLDKPA